MEDTDWGSLLADIMSANSRQRPVLARPSGLANGGADIPEAGLFCVAVTVSLRESVGAVDLTAVPLLEIYVVIPSAPCDILDDSLNSHSLFTVKGFTSQESNIQIIQQRGK